MGQCFCILIPASSQVQVTAFVVLLGSCSRNGLYFLYFFFFFLMYQFMKFPSILDVEFFLGEDGLIDILICEILWVYRQESLYFPTENCPFSFAANRQMLSPSRFCNSSNSKWFHYKTVTCIAELKPFITWSQQSMS